MFLFLFTACRLAMHDDATISFPRHLSILCCSSLDGPSFFNAKVFSMPVSAFDFAALYLIGCFYCMVFGRFFVFCFFFFRLLLLNSTIRST